MADAFKIKYQGQATPLEVLDAAGDATSTIVHGSIGKTITGGMEYELGSDSSFLEYTNYTTTTSEVELGGSTIFNKDLNIDWMMITITEAAGTGPPDCKIKLKVRAENCILNNSGNVSRAKTILKKLN